jgi:hypothetical protein
VNAALPTAPLAREPEDVYASHTPPAVKLEPYSPGDVHALIHGGELDADVCEALLVLSARGRTAIDVAIAEGLATLRRKNRLAELCFHLGDYAREVLDLAPRTGQLYARLGDGLRTRPLLRAAVLSGKVTFRAACEVLPVAKGEAEPEWVERASTKTVRALEVMVRAARKAAKEQDEQRLRFGVAMTDEERAVVDEALEVAEHLEPGSTPAEQLQAMAEEFLGFAAAVAEVPERVRLGNAFRRPREAAGDDEARREALEVETERWAHLPPVPGKAAPVVDFEALGTADAIDAELRKLAKLRKDWDAYLGYAARTIRDGRIMGILGFTSFRHYAEERLRIPGRAVEQRAGLEEALTTSAALRAARDQGLSYEKLRLLSRRLDPEIRAWTERAKTMTCVTLRRELAAAHARQMRAHRRFTAAGPESFALLLSAALDAARKLASAQISDGRCLAIIAAHFTETWKPHVKAPKTPSQKARKRDRYCQVPGCSHLAAEAHHKKYRSQGGSDELLNLLGICPFHHHQCIHEGYLKLVEKDGVRTWLRRGAVFTGRPN